MKLTMEQRALQLLREVFTEARANWTYGDPNKNLPAGWLITSDSGLMGKLRDFYENDED